MRTNLVDFENVQSSDIGLLKETAGNNAPDFHIAYYIGLLSDEDPSALLYSFCLEIESTNS